MQWSLGRLFSCWCLVLLNGLLLSMSCASDLASAPGAPKGDGANDLETLFKCLSDEAPNIQVGVYQDRFIPTDEDNQLSVRSDSDGGLSTVVALNLVGICPEELVTITLSIERDNNLIATTSFDYFEGFCTADTAWLMPQMGIPFIPGISLFDLVDQSATLEVQIQSNDESLSTQADITIVP